MDAEIGSFTRLQCKNAMVVPTVGEGWGAEKDGWLASDVRTSLSEVEMGESRKCTGGACQPTTEWAASVTPP